jgi:hypothetical protein
MLNRSIKFIYSLPATFKFRFPIPLLRILICDNGFPARKHEFGELNSHFSGQVFTNSAREALIRFLAGCHVCLLAPLEDLNLPVILDIA